MIMKTVVNPNTGERKNVFEIKVEGRTFWFLQTEIMLAESRPAYYEEV